MGKERTSFQLGRDTLDNGWTIRGKDMERTFILMQQCLKENGQMILRNHNDEVLSFY
jgi:hypothetical protein